MPAKLTEEKSLKKMFEDAVIEAIAEREAPKKKIPWIASQTDMLSEDWIVID